MAQPQLYIFHADLMITATFSHLQLGQLPRARCVCRSGRSGTELLGYTPSDGVALQ